MENYEEVWKVLADLLTVLRNKGETIQKDIVEDLRSAKTLINIYRIDQSKLETLSKIEFYLGNVEQTLLYLAEADFGKEFANGYLKKIVEARDKVFTPKSESSSRLIPGVPRDKHWIRVRIDEDVRADELEVLAKSFDLSHRKEKDSFLLIYGEEDKIKQLIRKMAEKRKNRG